MNEYSEMILNAVDNHMQNVVIDYGSRLKSYIQYEFAISNAELASSWRMHGYSFQMMPNSFIQHIEITPFVKDRNIYSFNICVKPESFIDEPDDKIEFFKKYVIGNAMKRFQNSIH